MEPYLIQANIDGEFCLLQHPGEIIERLLSTLAWDQVEFARRMGLSRKTINRIMHGKETISPDTALRLGRVLPPRAASDWLDLERQYRNRQRDVSEPLPLTENDWLKRIPIGELVRRKYICRHKSEDQQTHEVLRFFQMASMKAFAAYWGGILGISDFHGNKEAISRTINIATWLWIGDLYAQPTSERVYYNRRRFLDYLRELRENICALSQGQYKATRADIKGQRSEFCLIHLNRGPDNVVGVRFTRGFKRTPVHGSLRWIRCNCDPNRLGGKKLRREVPLIQMCHPGLDDGVFWVTFLHLAGHLLLHDRRKYFVETDEIPKNETWEREAEAFARGILFPQGSYEAFVQSSECKTISGICRFADEIRLTPGVVLECLQQDGRCARNTRLDKRIRKPINI